MAVSTSTRSKGASVGQKRCFIKWGEFKIKKRRLQKCAFLVEHSFISTTYIRICFSYVSTGQETMAMNGGLSGSGVGGAPIDQDKVTTVARDCLLAYVECQVGLRFFSS